LLRGGTIAPVIRPSIGLIIFGVAGNVSITKLFLAGIVPGILMGVAIGLTWWWVAKKENVPSAPKIAMPDRLRITAEGGSLSSDKAVVAFRNKLISAATITGAPAQFEQQRDDGTTARGHANTIEYQTTSGTVSFNHNAWLSYGRNEITGQQLVYNIRSQSVQGMTKPGAAKGDGRVRIVIQPDKPPKITTPGQEKEKKP